MAILGKKKSDVKEQNKTTIKCECKDEEIEVLYTDIHTIPTGYKGRLTFYTNCPLCGKKVYIDDTKLSTNFVRKMYIKCI